MLIFSFPSEPVIAYASVLATPGQHRLSTPDSSFCMHWGSCQARSGAPFLVRGRRGATAAGKRPFRRLVSGGFHSRTRTAASYFEQGIIHLLLSLPQLTLWPTAVSWTPPPPASSIKDNAPSGAISVWAAYKTQLILHAVSC